MAVQQIDDNELMNRIAATTARISAISDEMNLALKSQRQYEEQARDCYKQYLNLKEEREQLGKALVYDQTVQQTRRMHEATQKSLQEAEEAKSVANRAKVDLDKQSTDLQKLALELAEREKQLQLREAALTPPSAE